MISLSHLNSDQRQYFWMSAVIGALFLYLGFQARGVQSLMIFAIAVVELACALAIYRRWNCASLIYLAACILFILLGVIRWNIVGMNRNVGLMLAAGLMMLTGVYWLRKAMKVQQRTQNTDSADRAFSLPKERKPYFESLIQAYTDVFGPAQWTHHIVPKTLWLHPYADHIITFPPTENRPTWLYGTLLISTLSDSKTELILERPFEDTLGGIGTLARLTDYYLNHAPLHVWNTMGVYPFFGEDSPIRGLLVCSPPASLPRSLDHACGSIELRYLVGITEKQLSDAQATDDAAGDFTGAKALHAALNIDIAGIQYLQSLPETLDKSGQASQAKSTEGPGIKEP
jgi:hypothetical protein